MVVDTSLCPSNSCTVRMSWPLSNKWVAKLCRNVWPRKSSQASSALLTRLSEKDVFENNAPIVLSETFDRNHSSETLRALSRLPSRSRPRNRLASTELGRKSQQRH